MVSYKTILSSLNSLPSTLPSELKAVFVGATSGIGQSTLIHFARATVSKSPSIYVVGRSAKASTELLANLRTINSSANVVFIEKDVSLIRGVDEAVAEIKKNGLNRLDYLIMSVGFISFQGRVETKEGLEPSMTTRSYSRTRFIELFLPLLNASPNPHVLNVLAGGQEGRFGSSDLDLKDPKDYSIANAAVHSATMLTLNLEHYAAANPKISFVHSFPGLVSTPLLGRGSSGIVGFLMRWIVSPLVNSFGMSAEESGGRALFYATNARYTVEQTESLAAPLPKGLTKAKRSEGGVFLVHKDSESSGDESLLKELREKDGQRVWDHTVEIWNQALAK